MLLGCFSIARTCANGDIRIRDGVTASSGRVEVCITEIWGTVCDLGIDQSIAADICVKANFSGEGQTRVLYLYTSGPKFALGLHFSTKIEPSNNRHFKANTSAPCSKAVPIQEVKLCTSLQ